MANITTILQYASLGISYLTIFLDLLLFCIKLIFEQCPSFLAFLSYQFLVSSIIFSCYIITYILHILYGTFNFCAIVVTLRNFSLFPIFFTSLFMSIIVLLLIKDKHNIVNKKLILYIINGIFAWGHPLITLCIRLKSIVGNVEETFDELTCSETDEMQLLSIFGICITYAILFIIIYLFVAIMLYRTLTSNPGEFMVKYIKKILVYILCITLYLLLNIALVINRTFMTKKTVRDVCIFALNVLNPIMTLVFIWNETIATFLKGIICCKSGIFQKTSSIAMSSGSQLMNSEVKRHQEINSLEQIS